VQTPHRALQVFDAVFLAFAAGFLGYLLVPAVGPKDAFPSLFTSALNGGVVTRVNAEVVARGGAVYDAFPSLHILITVVLLDLDFRHARRRFWMMFPVVTGLAVSTVYFRYHYAVDLLAAVVMFVVLRAYLHRHPVRAGRPV
jgi:urea transporter